MVVPIFRVVTVIEIQIHKGTAQAPVLARIQVSVDIMPAGFIILGVKANIPVPAGVNLCRSGVPIGRLIDRAILISRSYFTQEKASIQRSSFNRNVNPHTDSICSFEVNRVSCANTGVHETAFEPGGKVTLCLHGIVPTMYLTGLRSRQRARTRANHIVIAPRCGAIKARYILILEVIKHRGTLTEFDGRGSS